MKNDYPEDTAIISRPNVVFNYYPANPGFFKPDLQPYVKEIIKTHGIEEWRASLLTHEMHRHLGIYSIIGVKMGILAREVSDTGLDDLSVEAYTGYQPPLSCLIDGLQVATGASLGRGKITVINNDTCYPEADFIINQECIKIKLKTDYLNVINSMINEMGRKYPSGSSSYFDNIRKISIKYWLEFSRYDIFEVVHFMKSIKKVN